MPKHSSSSSREALKEAAIAGLSRLGYQVSRQVGAGKFGIVFAAVNTLSDSRKNVAVKCIRKSPQTSQACLQEAHIWTQLEHPNILKLLAFFENNDFYFFESDLGTITLLEYLIWKKKLNLPEAREIFQDVAYGLQAMHQANIAHRDLKLENILLVDGRWKLCDFGFAIEFTEGEFSSYTCGSHHYVAPEIAERKPCLPRCTDAWALGCILYALLTGKMAFDAQSMWELKFKIVNCKYPKGYLNAIDDPQAVEIVHLLLKRDIQERLSVDQVVQEKWVQSDDHCMVDTNTDADTASVAKRRSSAMMEQPSTTRNLAR